MNQVAHIPETSAAPHTVPAPSVTPMSLLQSAVASGNLDLAEKLMSLQDRWEATNARKAFEQAIASAGAEFPVIIRNATGHNNKKYADFAAIASVVDPILGKYGLRFRFRTVQTEKLITVTCILFGHGHSEETTLSGPADTSGNKNAIQSIGSTLTYLQRYSLVQMLGLAAAADDDGKTAAAGEAITQKQADDLRDLIEAKGASRDAFMKWATKLCGAERIEDIPATHLEACIKAVNNYKAPAK